MHQIKTVAIIGAGAWGTAVAKSIAESRPQVAVKIWAHERSVVSSINAARENEFLPGIKLPPNITAYAGLREALEGAHVVLLAPPSRFIFDIAQKMARYVTAEMYVGFLTKGFCKLQNRVLTISQAIEKAVPRLEGKVVAISGPSHAEEVSRGFHTCLNVGSRSAGSRAVIAELLTSDFLRCRQTDDIRGVEVGGTLKNPAAIAAGMISALPHCGDNLAGALIAESLKEMIRLGRLFGISDETMIDISGLGDLVATALSRHSRNRRFGRDIAKKILERGKTLGFPGRIMARLRPKSIIEDMSRSFNYLAEGAYAIEPLIELAESENISIPLYRSLYEVLLNKKDPSLLIETIKDPSRFNELYYNTKTRLLSRKGGLEGASGRVFRGMIIDKIVEKFTAQRAGQAGGYEAGEVIRHLHEFYGSAAALSGDTIPAAEQSLANRLSRENYAESIRQLAELYFKRIADNFYPPFKWLFHLYTLFVRIIDLFSQPRSPIIVSGRLKGIRGIGSAANILYVSTFTSVYDFVLLIIAILRKGLPFPRFFISADALDHRHASFYRQVGGFLVDRGMLENLLYRETLCQYLSILAGHGVPVLYSPFHSSGKNSDQTENEVFTAITEALFTHTADTALVPVEVSYLRRPAVPESGTLPLRKVAANAVSINFSEPLYLSEYAHRPSRVTDVAGVLKSVWLTDKKVFPHYLLCKILVQNNFSVKLDSAVKLVEGYISREGRRFDYRPPVIVKRGLNFLIRSGSAAVRDGRIVALNAADIEFYSGMLE
ncbi:MAG: hypothetical protein A2W19_01270 [Spirochaetes bacterium RBG_16_49_21]|nr:MAG: hypothetical protein A2W19_01270 [Spirochaetes bacterium RBG_16_49_21]